MRIVVVGAGVSGLSSAVRLAEAGHSVQIWTRERPLRTTSAVAAAIWYPYRTDPADRVLGWAGLTLREFLRLSTDRATGIVMREGLELFPMPVDDPWWAAVVPGFRRAARGELPPGFVDGYGMRLPVIDMSLYLEWLERRARAAGVSLTERGIESLEELRGAADVIVNCTGLGARDLCDDSELFGVRGQIVVVEAPDVSAFLVDDATVTYIIPRCHDVVLGGTTEEHVYDTRIDEKTAASILERCTHLVPSLASAPVRRHKAGIRPCRTTVRLEPEMLGGQPIVHNYGHGGAGVTLSWGCADEVTSLCNGTGAAAGAAWASLRSPES